MIKTATLLVFLCSTVFSSVGQWTQLQPLPVSDNINCIRFTDTNNGLAVCGNGIILKTSDGGVTWHRTNTGTRAFLKKVHYLNATTVVACGFGSTILRSVDGGENWAAIPVTNISDFWAMSFSGNTGYVAGAAAQNSFSMAKTTDGGLTWNMITTISAPYFRSLDFISPDAGYAGRNNGYLYKTLNGGLTWDSIYVGGSIEAMDWLTVDTGYVLGPSDLMRTYDGGLNWLTCFTLSGIGIRDIFILNADTVYIAGPYGIVEVATDGAIFSDITSILEPYDANSIFLLNDSILFVGGEAGMLRKSMNGGANWTNIQQGFPFTFYSGFFINDSTAYTCGYRGTILKTTDRFHSVTRQNNQANVTLYDICFTNPDTGFAVGTGGLIKKTINAGTNWTDAIPPSSGIVRSVYFTGADTGFVVGDSRIIMKTTDRGVTWDTLNHGANMNYVKVRFIDKEIGFILCTYRSILRTDDGGNTWTAPNFPSPPPSNFLAWVDMSFPTHDIGYIVGNDSTFLKTTDAGLNWQPYPTPFALYLNAVKFIDANTGYVSSNDQMFYTTDGGMTFTEQIKQCGREMFSIEISPDGIAYAFGRYGAVITNDSSLTTGISHLTPPADNGSYTLFPNPAINTISVIQNSETAGNKPVEIGIYDVSGRCLMLEKKVLSKETSLDVSALAPGIYFISFESTDGMSMLKFIKD